MQAVHTYDQVHVISDLHMGGADGFQVFDLGLPLKRLVDHLSEVPTSTRLALVINGDMVDFLAERRATYFDPVGAIRKLERIAADPAFAPVWEALRAFVRQPGRHLVITLGNHDLELALPWVRERLLELLSKGCESARGRVLLSFDGSGFRCRVGDQEVLCVHGNEVDTVNATDYEALRRIGCEVHLGKHPQPWIPNAGTRLVIDAMNEIKKRHVFIDLLKPEFKAAIMVLVAINPAQLAKILRLVPVTGHFIRDWTRRAMDFLSADDSPEENLSASDLLGGLEAALGRVPDSEPRYKGRPEDATTLLDETEERLRAGQDPLSLIPLDKQEAYLDYFGDTWGALRHRVWNPKRVRHVLRQWLNDQHFDRRHADRAFEKLDRLSHPKIDVLVAGHTHLERRIRRPSGGLYLNSGTWIPLLRLSSEDLASEDKFNEILTQLKAGNREALEAIVLRRPAVVSIRDEGGKVSAVLRRVESDPDPEKPLFPDEVE